MLSSKIGLLFLLGGASLASAAVFNTANTADAGSWGTVTGQSFSPSISATPDPGLTASSTVYLQQFQFFKGNPAGADSGANFALVILDGAYPNLSGLTTSSTAVVGMSTNTIATTAGYASGDAITFGFNNLPLVYGNTYAAGLFVQSGDTLTPVTIAALTANYSSTDGGVTYLPTTNYGGLDNYNASAYGGTTTGEFGTYYNAYGRGGDANFYATLSTEVPEPAIAGLLTGGMALLARRRK